MSHLSVPLRRIHRPDGSGGGLALDEQDSPEEINACTFAVLGTPIGYRTDLPEFGSPRNAHRRGGANIPAIERALAEWEPRADVVGFRDSGMLRRALNGELDTVQFRQGPR